MELETRIKTGYRVLPGTGPAPVVDAGFMSAYQSARAQFERYDYNGAIESFQALLQQNPNHSMADNCQYWIGESYFGLKQYQKAIMEFQKVFAYGPADKHDDARPFLFFQ